jgi:hypothetical protein
VVVFGFLHFFLAKAEEEKKASLFENVITGTGNWNWKANFTMVGVLVC